MAGWRVFRRPLLWAILVVAVWMLVGGPLGSFPGRLAEVQENDEASFLPETAEATRAGEQEERFVDADTVPAVVVAERPGGLTADDEEALAGFVTDVATVDGVVGSPTPPEISDDGAAAQLVVPIEDGDALETAVEDIRAAAEDAAEDSGAGLRTYVTGPAGYTADLTDAFGAIDGLLLAVTASVVAVILVLVYRSPLLPLLVLVGAGLALGTAAATVYGLARADILFLNGQSQGIMLILVFGAATDYALLLVARYREELEQRQDRFEAIAKAWRRSVGPILASGTTVIFALLCLLLSDLNSNRSVGPVGAVGVAAALLVMLTYLPAVLALFGRAGFWPFRPRYGSPLSERRGLWERLAGVIGRRARTAWVVTSLALAALATLTIGLDADGVAESELFLTEAESADGQEALNRHFPPGELGPTVIIADAAAREPVAATADAVDGVTRVQPAGEDGDRVRILAVLDDPPDSDAAAATVRELRTALADVPGDEALVGGPTAVDVDVRDASERDRMVIIPLALLVVFIIIALLLRALLVTFLLLCSVILSFAAALGLSTVVFDVVFGFPGMEPALPLYAFVFLVALGVDYSIFLLTRVREEATQIGTRPAVRVGLSVTGRVITSAGVVLAATFSALGVVPILFLAQIGFIVAVGVLIDTMIVRSLLIPGLCHDIGPSIWWPSRLRRVPDRAE